MLKNRLIGFWWGMKKNLKYGATKAAMAIMQLELIDF